MAPLRVSVLVLLAAVQTAVATRAKSTDITADEIFDDDFDPMLLEPKARAEFLGTNYTPASSLAQVGTKSNTSAQGSGISCCKQDVERKWTRRDVTDYVGTLCEKDECIIMSYLRCDQVLPDRRYKCSTAANPEVVENYEKYVFKGEEEEGQASLLEAGGSVSEEEAEAALLEALAILDAKESAEPKKRVQSLSEEYAEPKMRMQKRMQSLSEEYAEPTKRMQKRMQSLSEEYAEPKKRMQKRMQSLSEEDAEPKD